MNRYIVLTTFVFAASLTFSCSKDEAVPAPTADFAPVISNLAVTFNNECTNSRFFHWDFGDNSEPSAEYSPAHFYESEGTYTVTLTVTGRNGETKTVSKEIAVTAPPNFVKGGKFDPGDEAEWTVINISPGVDLNIAGGKAVFTGSGFGQAALYQPIEVEAGKTYSFSMLVSGSGATDTWFEVYFGSAQPVDGSDYSDGGRVFGLSTWDGCGGQPFSGNITQIGCVGSLKDANGEISFVQTGTVYLLIKSGGGDLGTGGISIDNVSLSEN